MNYLQRIGRYLTSVSIDIPISILYNTICAVCIFYLYNIKLTIYYDTGLNDMHKNK